MTEKMVEVGGAHDFFFSCVHLENKKFSGAARLFLSFHLVFFLFCVCVCVCVCLLGGGGDFLVIFVCFCC